MIFKEHKIVSRSLIMLFLAFMIIGAVTFIVQAAGDHPEKAWQAYLINFLLFSAISQGGLLFSIVMNTTGARWSRLLSGVSESFAAFFPVSFVLFLILFIGKGHVFPWLEINLHGKQVWLNLPFLFIRNFIGLFILYALGFAYLYHALWFKLPHGQRAFRHFRPAGPPPAAAACGFQEISQTNDGLWQPLYSGFCPGAFADRL